MTSNKLVKWNQSVDCCSWEGVTCHEGRVIGLDLTNESISGGLDDTSSLFSLQHLQSLSLAYNDFNYSQIPSQFDKLANLSYLNLSYANFVGQIPIAISHLTRLVTLDLSCNYYRLYLENPNLNMLIQNLSDLIELHLDDVAISMQGKEWCRILSSSLPNLRVLSLSNCDLLGPIDSSLRNLKSLSVIRLNGNNIASPVPIFFANFKNLTSLEVSSSWLNGTFPKKIFQVPTLQMLDLSNNEDLQGSLPEFPLNGSFRTMVLRGTNFSGTLPHSIGNLKMLSTLDVSYCNFSGSIPDSMASLTQLVFLDMSSNMFSGSIPAFSMAKNLTNLDLSSNNLTGQITSTQWEQLLKLEYLYLDKNSLNGSIPVSLFSLRSLKVLGLWSNQFSGQLKEFSNVSSYMLEYIDLNDNQLEGPIPMSIFEYRGLKGLSLGSNKFNNSLDLSVIQPLKNLSYLDLSHINLLTEYNDFNFSLSLVQLQTVILASCKLKKFPDFLRNQSNLYYLDLSNNQIYGELATSIGQFGAFAQYLSFSSNKFHGSIPRSICNATQLQLIDLSNNSFGGEIPQCLIEMSGIELEVLNLRKNKLNGTIPDAFSDNCDLQILALNKNQLEGGLPKSLANCSRLEVLDIGNNHIEGTFPFYLNHASLRVLVLRSNKFYGPISNPKHNAPWPMLQIVDVASNNFTGNLPIMLLSSCMAMMDRAHEAHSRLSYLQISTPNGFYYQDTITITNKGLEVELVKILTIVVNLDFSCNNFDGPLPKEIGELTLLYILNLSHNALTGEIPASLGKLSNLESLDLSNNELTGKIPVQLANGLIFLSVLNLSFNQLVGQIPFIKQFATFSENSFKGNERLCDLPLKSQCSLEEPRLPPPTYEESNWSMIDWNYISAELGFVFGFGFAIGPLMFWKRWRIWYYKHVDDILFKIFPQLYLGKEHHRRQTFRNQGLRH
ncbi:receptor-like protein 6 [Alnus glutinosa]|uniref:receptor-like protein 6 n=1 Tax=Alnus glutinosa TaxID=3517 RepID=UPI002D787B54|nr:receptor-like protein 6 [Alnus glutinosa]